MASVLDLVKCYQRGIEDYIHDENTVLKCIDKLYRLDVKVQHLQETGVGRTMNALRKEPGAVGHAARALVYKWKIMVAAEASDQEGDQDDLDDSENCNGNGKDSDDSAKQPRSRQNRVKNSNEDSRDHKHTNGDHSGKKRKYHSSEEEEPDIKISKHYSSSENNEQKRKQVQVKIEPHSDSDSQDSVSQSDSDFNLSESSVDEKNGKIKTESPEKVTSSSYSPYNNIEVKKEPSSSSKLYEADKHSKHHSAESKHSSDESTSKKTPHSSSEKSSKGTKFSEKKHSSEHKTSEKEKRHKEESRSSSKHSSSGSKEKKHRSSSQIPDSTVKHKSSSSASSSKEKHTSSSSSHKTEKEKHKSSSDKEMSNEKHKSRDSSSSKEKHSCSSKEKDKSSFKEKSGSHKSDKKHSSSSDKSKSSDNKVKKERNEDGSGKSSHKSSSSSSHKSKSSSSKSKEEIPKKKIPVNNSEDSDESYDCGSGASFAEVLGMIAPTKSKKKSSPVKDVNSPNNSLSNDLSASAMLAPSAKLMPLPALQISALPEISPNYKPRPPPKFLPHFDDDAMCQVISSKNQRTKVYSGNKVVGKVPTLYEMCVNILQEHIDALEYTGGVPYDILKPVVDKATPHQLFVLEHYNPYLMDDTDHLWQKHCEKNFRNKKRHEMETWREMYMRCQEEQEHKLKSLTANIRMTQEAKKAPIKQTKMAYVDSVVKPPRNVARKQAMHGTKYAATASPAARVAALSSQPNVLKGGAVRPVPAAPVSASAFNKPKKAPLMQKALQLMRGRKR